MDDEDTIEKLDKKIEKKTKKKNEISSKISKILEERSKIRRNRDIIFDQINMEILKINNHRFLLLDRYANLMERLQNENWVNRDDERSRIENSLDKMNSELPEFSNENNNAIEKYRDEQREIDEEFERFYQDSEYNLKQLNQTFQMYILEVRRLVNERFRMSREDENDEKRRKIGGKRNKKVSTKKQRSKSISGSKRKSIKKKGGMEKEENKKSVRFDPLKNKIERSASEDEFRILNLGPDYPKQVRENRKKVPRTNADILSIRRDVKWANDRNGPQYPPPVTSPLGVSLPPRKIRQQDPKYQRRPKRDRSLSSSSRNNPQTNRVSEEVLNASLEALEKEGGNKKIR